MRSSLRPLVVAVVLLPLLAVGSADTRAANVALERPTPTIAKSVIKRQMLAMYKDWSHVKATVSFRSFKLGATRRATAADTRTQDPIHRPSLGAPVTPFWSEVEVRVIGTTRVDNELRRFCDWHRVRPTGILWRRKDTRAWIAMPTRTMGSRWRQQIKFEPC